MKFGTSWFQGKPASLEEGPAKYCSTNEHYALHRDNNGTNCGRFGQIVKVMLYIELIILIGWLGHVSFSYYNIDRNSDYGGSPMSVGKSYVVPDEDLIPRRDQRSIPESRTTKCWSEEEDRILKEERQERMDAFASRIMKKEADHSYTKAYLKSIEAALSAASVSEMNTVDCPPKSHIHRYIESLSENSSLELRKEGCEINRDLHLEFYKLKNHHPEWVGYNPDSIQENLTASNFFAVNLTKEAIFNDLVRFSNIVNLRYIELGNRESGDAPNKPVFGKFAYAGEELENPGPRRLRHILDAFVKLYFKMHEPSSVCASKTRTAGPTSESNNTECWNVEQDPIFLEERRQRVEGYPTWLERLEAEQLYTTNYLGAIEQALNATSASEIHFEHSLVESAPLLWLLEHYGKNASLMLHKEALELARDLYLEIEELKEQLPHWEGYNYNTILKNLTESSEPNVWPYKTARRSIFFDFTSFERAFKLRYEDMEDKTGVLQKVTYHGEEPEKLGVRRIRHILDGVVRFYFKVRYPSTWGVCDSTAQTSAKLSIEKRSVPEGPVTESLTTKCWSEKDDWILRKERLERQRTFGFLRWYNMESDSHMKELLKCFEAALKAKSISEFNLVHFPNRQKPMKYLSENSSLELRKELYEIDRDLYLEVYKLNHHSPDWDGYNRFHILSNISDGNFFIGHFTKEAIFNDLVRLSNIFNLRYIELGNRESGDAPNKPVFGKFAYAGEELENPGPRRLRHILDAFVKLYFKMHEPSSVCASKTRTAGPTSESTNTECWNVEQDPIFLEERRQRVEGYPTWLERVEAEQLYTTNYLGAIEQALNATSASEIHFDHSLVESAPLLWLLEHYAKNVCLVLHKKALELARDLYIEIEELKEQLPHWEGYNYNTILKNLTESSEPNVWPYKTARRSIFFDFTSFERAFKLRYENIEDKTGVLQKVTYHGEEPEKLGVRRIRHILDGVVRFYFKVQYPSTGGLYNLTAQTSAKPSIEKLSVPEDPVPESLTTKCWSEEEDKILEDDRRERQKAFASRSSLQEADNSYTKEHLKGIEAALKATSISEINSLHFPRKAHFHRYMEYLCENSSLELRKEGYEIDRDLRLELYKFKNHSPEWDGYNLNRVHDNLTAGHFFAHNFTKETVFNDIVKFGNAFNLRYEELGNRESGDEPSKPVFGKFTYGGEEPEKLGVRHLRHILDAFVKFYFKMNEPSSVCGSETRTAGAASEPTNTKCWNVEQDPVFLEERRERVEGYPTWLERREAEQLYTKNYMNAIEQALNATRELQIYFIQDFLTSAPILLTAWLHAQNASSESRKEALGIARDVYLEIEELKEQSSAWEGYDYNTILNNLSSEPNVWPYKTPPITIFFDKTSFERVFKLSYKHLEAEPGVLRKVTYHGEEPETLGVRRLRRILNSAVRFYCKILYPSLAPGYQSRAEGGGNATE